MKERGISHLIISDGKLSSASEVSAGMMNPIVFKRITKSWNVDTLLPFAKNIYKRIETELKKEYLINYKIAKIISSEDEINWWKQRVESQSLDNYFDGIYDNNLIDFVSGVHKYAVINQAAHLNVSDMIDDYRIKLSEELSIVNERFDFNKLILTKNRIEYGNIKANKIIFCEGAHIIHNPYFNFIPFYLTKGNLLTVKLKNFSNKYIISKDKFLLPYKDYFIFGSNYINTKHPTASLNLQEKEKLIKKLQAMVKVPFELINHQYGVRPTIKDRRPVLGYHPVHEQLVVFNGLGTKGTMLAPYHANLLLDFLEGIVPVLNKEISINRFKTH
jgi:hypothetical protein